MTSRPPQGGGPADVQMKTSHGKNLVMDTFFYALPQFLPAVGQVLLTPVFTAYLSPTDYGVLAMLAAIGQLVAIVMWLNMNSGVQRFYFDYEGDERRQFLGTIALGSLVFSALIFVVLLILGPGLARRMFAGAALPFWPLVAAEIATAFLGTAIIVPAALLKNERRSRTWSFIQLGAWLAGTGLTVYFIVALRDGAWGKIKAQVMVAGLLFVAYWLIMLRHVALGFRGRMFRENLVFGLPFLGKAVFAYIYRFSDRWILERFVPMAHLGFYSLGDSFARLLQMGQCAFADAWMPYFYREAKRDPAAAARLARDMSYLWAVLMVAVTLAFCLFLKPALYLLANVRFHDPLVVASAQLLALAYFFAALDIFFLYALGFTKTNLPILTTTIMAAIINVAANALLIPWFGVLGAGWARVMAFAGHMVLLYWAAQKVFPVAYPVAAVLRLMLLAAVVFALAMATATGRMAIDLPKDLALLAGFVAALFAFRFVDYRQMRGFATSLVRRGGRKADL